MTTIDSGRALREALVSAYRPYLEATLTRHGIDPAGHGMPAAADEGEAWLAAELDDLLGRPFGEQARGPLEVFQEAMRYPTTALETAGVPAARRDPVAAEALPGDRYDLAPASSQALGDAVWEAHLAWGAAKAMALRPTVALLSSDLMDCSRVEPVVEAAGFNVAMWRAAADAAGGMAMVLVDLTHGDADEVIRAQAEQGVRVVAFGPHVDEFAMVRARSLGAADAVPRSVFFRNLGRLLPTVA